MVTPTSLPASRYRRRILALGAIATGALYVIGAPIFNSRIEADLERRVPEELAAAGFTGVDVVFSGQDGTITCTEPLGDPDDALEVAFGVHGVRQVELVQNDDSPCRVRTATRTDEGDGAGGTSNEDGDDDGGEASDSSDEEATATEASGDPVDADAGDTTTDAELATIGDVVAANPELGFLSVLLVEADLGSVDGPVTLFAPRNSAFDAVSADVLGRLQNDAELLDAVLSHHVVEGAHRVADLTAGELDALDGTSVTIEVDDDGGATVDGAAIVEADIAASNGIVHVVDRLLLPPGVDLDAVGAPAEARADFDGEVIALTGVVASEVERQIVLDAAVAAVGSDAVVDDFTVDPDTGIDADAASRIAELIEAMPANLVRGAAGFDGEALFANGIVADEVGRGVFAVAAATAGVVAVIEVDPDAVEQPDDESTADDVAALEDQLNEIVAADPVRFQPGSSLIADDVAPVLDQLADAALQLTDVQISVEGHTDSDGVAIENLQLSQNRAEAVRDALIDRGLDPDTVTAVGFGSEQPVLVDGVEDKEASRRVEFRVVAVT